jgi:hypothetical protein
MEQRIAKIISGVFHPLFIPLYAILFLLGSDTYVSLLIPLKGKLMLGGIVLLTTVLMPLLTSFLLIRAKIIHSWFPEVREERIYLLLNTAVFYYLTYYIMKGSHVTMIFGYFMLGSTFLVICALVITFFHRISLHMIAMGGLLGGALALGIGHPLNITGLILALILIAGVTGTARLMIHPQKPREIYSGLLVGIFVMFFLFILV